MTEKELSEKYPQAIKMCGSKHMPRMMPKEVTEALLDAFWHQRENKDMIALCEDVKMRLDGIFTDKTCTKDGDILYGTLVNLYGTCGGAPRTGWIEEKDVISQIIETLDDGIKSYKECIEIYGE